jgi:hypothetical protein
MDIVVLIPEDRESESVKQRVRDVLDVREGQMA